MLGNLKNKSLVLYVIIALVGFGAGWVICSMTSDSSRRTMELTFPGVAGLKIDISQPEIAHDKLLKDIFAQQFSRDGLMGWLADKDIFVFKDERLVEALNKRLCDIIPEHPLDRKIKAAQDCAELPVSTSLRQLADQKRVPFHYVGIAVNVGVPEREDQPQIRQASVCANSALHGERVELTNPRTGNRIDVQATGRYTCTGFTTYPDIQLTFEDARKLFSEPLGKYQEAVAVVLN